MQSWVRPHLGGRLYSVLMVKKNHESPARLRKGRAYVADKLKSVCQLLGLHPFVGFGMFAVDWMLFGVETGSIGGSWIVSIAAAVLLTIPSILIQKSNFKDDWFGAFGKGMMVGVLTAIPTALPSVGTAIFTAIGIGKYLLPGGKEIAKEKEQ